MRNLMILFCAAAGLAGCNQSNSSPAGNEASPNTSAAEAQKPAAYCFFKDEETKGWKAALDKSGNVVVSGKAYREDPRYKAVLSPPTVSGATAEVAPTIAQNDTGFASPDNWWAVSETIPDSQAVETVTVKCGAKTLASLTVPRKK